MELDSVANTTCWGVNGGGLPRPQHTEAAKTLRFTGFRGFQDTQLIVLELMSSKTIS